MTQSLFNYNGFTVYTNECMTVDGPPYQIRRTWRERLLTLPWQPLKRTYTVVPQVPDKEVIIYGHTMTMHPVTAEKLREALRKKDHLISVKPHVFPFPGEPR